MESRPFDVDELTGAVETFHFDHTTDTFVIQRQEDVESVLELNKRLSNASPDHWRGDWHKVASIPNGLLPELESQGLISAGGRILDVTRFKHWLNDSENRFFRTRPGRI